LVVCVESGVPHLPRKMSLLINSANPNPKHNPEANSPMTSDPCRVAIRGLPMALMNGGTPDSNTNTPTKIRALPAAFWSSVGSELFVITPTYRPYQV